MKDLNLEAYYKTGFPCPLICLLTCVCLPFPKMGPNHCLEIQSIWPNPENVSRLPETLLGIRSAFVHHLPAGLELILRLISAQIQNDFMVPPTWFHPATEETQRCWFQSRLVSSSTQFLRFYDLDLGLSPIVNKLPLSPDYCGLTSLGQSAHLGSQHVSNDPSGYLWENSIALDHILSYN